MPVTFFAHQAPVLPAARRWPRYTDGLALVVGSMAPDFAYALHGSRISVWAHAFPGLVTFCVPVTLAVSWLVARVVSPVLGPMLPSLGSFRLDEYRGLAVHRFRWVVAAASALVGALSHVAIDHFTHDWGWFAQHVDWYRTVLVHDLLGREWTVFLVLQNVAHLGGTVWCVWLLWRYGRRGWFSASAAQVPNPRTTAGAVLVVGLCTFVAGAFGVASIAAHRVEKATDIIRLAAALFAGLVVGCAVEAFRRRRAVG